VYWGGTTAEGQSALFNLTSGEYNTAGGLYSLLVNSTANSNTAIGAGTLFAHTETWKHCHRRWRSLQQYHRNRKHGQWSIRLV
jgi:hypothetical protein